MWKLKDFRYVYDVCVNLHNARNCIVHPCLELWRNYSSKWLTCISSYISSYINKNHKQFYLSKSLFVCSGFIVPLENFSLIWIRHNQNVIPYIKNTTPNFPYCWTCGFNLNAFEWINSYLNKSWRCKNLTLFFV